MAGRPRAFDDEDVLIVLYESDDPAMTAREIADRLGENRRTVLRRLKQLQVEGEVEKKDIGARATIWWLDGGTKELIDDNRP